MKLLAPLFPAPRNLGPPPLPNTGSRTGSITTDAAPLDYRRHSRAYMHNEIVFAAVEMLATSAGEPHIVGRRFRRDSPQLRRDVRAVVKSERDKLRRSGLAIGDIERRLVSNGFFLELPSHPLISLLNNPNPWMSRGQMWGTVVMDRAIAGNAYLLKGRHTEGMLKGTVGELWRLRPDRVRIIPGSNFIEGYEYGLERGNKVVFPAKDVMHFKTRHPLDDYYGLPQLSVVMSRVAIDEYMENFLRGFFERGGTGPGSILTVKQEMKQEDKDDIRDRFKRQFGGPEGYHEMMILDNAETSYEQLGLDRGLRDALPVELDALSETRIAMVFGIPGSILGLRIGYESSSYANKRQDWQVFWDLTMTPLLSDLDDTLNRELVPEFGLIDEVFFDLSGIRALQEDVDLMQERARANLHAGGLSWEEFRETIGLDPDPPDGLVFFVPTSGNPTRREDIADVALPGAPEDNNGGGGDDDDEDEDESDNEDNEDAENRLPQAEIMDEVHCPKCDLWLGRNMNVGAVVRCRKCKREVVVGGASQGRTTVKTVERDDDGRVARVVEVVE